MRVLIAEDDDASRELLAEYFAAAGWEVTTAADGAQAVRLAKEVCPDVALLDIRMPVIDGLQALRLMRADPATAHVQAIAISAAAVPSPPLRGRRAEGFQAHFRKPLDLWALLARATFLASPTAD